MLYSNWREKILSRSTSRRTRDSMWSAIQRKSERNPETKGLYEASQKLVYYYN